MFRRLWLRWLCYYNDICYKHGVPFSKAIEDGYGGYDRVCPKCHNEHYVKTFINNQRAVVVGKWRKEFERKEY